MQSPENMGRSAMAMLKSYFYLSRGRSPERNEYYSQQARNRKNHRFTAEPKWSTHWGMPVKVREKRITRHNGQNLQL